MEGLGVLAEMGELTRRGEPFALWTVFWRQGPSWSQSGSRAIITADGELHGWIGGACAEPVVVREAQQVMAEGTGRVPLLGNPAPVGGGGRGGACADPVVFREAQQVMAEGTARLLLLGTPEQFGAAVPAGMTVVPISCQSEGALEGDIE